MKLSIGSFWLGDPVTWKVQRVTLESIEHGASLEVVFADGTKGDVMQTTDGGISLYKDGVAVSSGRGPVVLEDL